MSEDDPTYYTRVSTEDAERIEEFRQQHDLNKSEAIRAIVEDHMEIVDYSSASLGETDQIKEFIAIGRRQESFLKQLGSWMTFIGITASLALAVSALMIRAAAEIGTTIGIDPSLLLVAMAVTVIVAVIGWLLRSSQAVEDFGNRVRRKEVQS